MSGSTTRARASETRCCWPPDSSAGYRSASVASRVVARMAVTFLAMVARLRLRTASPYATFSATVMCGQSAWVWNTMETLRRSGGSVRPGEETTLSPRRISPAEGSMNPATRRSAVVFPQPDGPSRQTSCPCSISSETPSSAVSSPNRLVRPRRITDDTAAPTCR